MVLHVLKPRKRKGNCVAKVVEPKRVNLCVIIKVYE